MRERRFGEISYNQIIWILTVILLSGFIIFEMYSWGKYLFLLLSFFIFAIDNITHKGSSIALGPFQLHFGVFVVYCFMTSIWALSSSNAIEFSITLAMIFACLFMIIPHYMRDENISQLLSAIMWAGVVIAIYAIKYYGFSTLIASSKTVGIRLGNSFSNINTIGMFCAMGVVIQFERWLYKKKFELSIPFVMISVLVVACTQSRKALTLIILGCAILVIMKNYDVRNIVKSALKLVGIIIAFCLVVFLVSQISVFSGVQERMGQLLSAVTGKGELDSGSVNRLIMTDLGIRTWKQHPILGVGLNCTRIVVARELGFNAYLHNNYVEVLCATGLVGFILYYGMYVYLFCQLQKYGKNDRRYYVFGIMWLIISLVMDVGMVSYYGKIQCFYLMTQFLNVQLLKNKLREDEGKK